MGALQELPNIGKELEKLLMEAGFDTPDRLRAAGTREVFSRLKALDPTACLPKLYAVDGAVKGIRWHFLSADEKRELNEFFKSL